MREIGKLFNDGQHGKHQSRIHLKLVFGFATYQINMPLMVFFQ